ncbi:MAG: internal scaffolding protein [Microviridae sp.]|nr:MAG: internal scaffolding protein [Microviridae sp.]
MDDYEPKASEVDAQTFTDGQMFDFYKPHSSYGISDWSPSLTRQEFAEECDINVIMARYERTGQLPANVSEPMYVDMTSMPPDFRTAMDMMLDADKAFMTLPARVRREFDNDAKEFVDFASNPDNLEQMREWGLAPPAEALASSAGGGGPQAPGGEPAASAAPGEPLKSS